MVSLLPAKGSGVAVTVRLPTLAVPLLALAVVATRGDAAARSFGSVSRVVMPFAARVTGCRRKRSPPCALLMSIRMPSTTSPLVATTATANTGTASVSDLTVTTSPLPFAGSSETISFARLSPPVNGFDYEYTSSITGTPVPWNTGQPVVGANGFSLQISGVPGDGDTISIDPTPASAIASNNGNARSLLALRDAAIVDGKSATDSWSHTLADVGVRVQSAQSAADISSAMATQAEEIRSGETGVNLDEEAARLIQFQQSYQAAAKVLQIAQSVFDTLLQTAAR